jgi:phosphoglycolate phosphatase-like HAD superfamily hydrolase
LTPAGARLRAVLFDVDGTLVDSNDAHARAWLEVLASFGYPADPAQVRRMIGMGGDKIVAALTDLPPDSARGKDLLAERQARFLGTYFPSVRGFPGGRELLLRLRADGFLTAIATSAKPDELAPLLERARVTDLFDRQATSGDAEESKPDPDIVHAALRRLGIAPAEAIMIGDTPFDDEACRRAGVAFVAVRSGGWTDADFQSAVAIYDDVRAILLQYPDAIAAVTSQRRLRGE